jgi:1-acyl-sn-glycerol-3-phosphate acyltransferase
MAFFKRDVFGNIILVKRMLISTIGMLTFPSFSWLNKTKIEGTEHLSNLPATNVLFVSNHQTYFADVIAYLHVFCSVKWKFKNSISNPIYLLNPQNNTSFIAAQETMKSGLLPKIFSYVGSVQVKRTWREAGKDINRKVNINEFGVIEKALNKGWVITFPQGTTTPFAPGRRGTAHIIKQYKPVVVPVVIDGFRRAFDKKGLRLKKRGVELSIRFKKPLEVDYEAGSDEILEKIMIAIEQSDAFHPHVNSLDTLTENSKAAL